MKRIAFIFSLILMSSLTLIAQQERKSKPKAQMAFASLSHDYGSVVYGADGTYRFNFTNNANKPIVITNVKSSCGCTIPSWPKEPIQPGKTGSIVVKYNTKLSGSFNKTVQVFSTADNSPVKLSIRGKVNAKPSDLKKANSSSKLLNGTGIKKGVGTESEKKATTKESTATTQITADGMGGETLSKRKQSKKQAYQKKVEAQKKIKK